MKWNEDVTGKKRNLPNVHNEKKLMLLDDVSWGFEHAY